MIFYIKLLTLVAWTYIKSGNSKTTSPIQWPWFWMIEMHFIIKVNHIWCTHLPLTYRWKLLSWRELWVKVGLCCMLSHVPPHILQMDKNNLTLKQRNTTMFIKDISKNGGGALSVTSVCPSVVIKIWCPLNNFWKTASIQFKFGMLIYTFVISKHRSSSIWVTIH